MCACKRRLVSVSAIEVLFDLAAEFFGSGEGFEARGRIQFLVEPFCFAEAAVALGKERVQRRPAIRQHMPGGAANGATKVGVQGAAKRPASSRAGRTREEKAAAHGTGRGLAKQRADGSAGRR